MHEAPCQRKVPFSHSHMSPNHQHSLSHTLCAPRLFQLLKCFLLGAGKIQLSCKRMNGPAGSCPAQKSPHKPRGHMKSVCFAAGGCFRELLGHNSLLATGLGHLLGMELRACGLPAALKPKEIKVAQEGLSWKKDLGPLKSEVLQSRGSPFNSLAEETEPCSCPEWF